VSFSRNYTFNAQYVTSSLHYIGDISNKSVVSGLLFHHFIVTLFARQVIDIVQCMYMYLQVNSDLSVPSLVVEKLFLHHTV
jgi:hypothetical protein